MRFIHIADVHLGVSPDAGKAYSAKRSSEIWDTFRALLDVCQKDKIDLLLIAGDLFHRQPLLRELKEVNYLFSKLTRTKVVLIAGNHDYIKKDSHYRTFQWSENVYPLFQRKMKGVRFPEWKTAVYGFSYYEREITEPRYDNAKAPRLERYEILLAHGGDEKHIPIRREQLMTLGYEYVALGHIVRRRFWIIMPDTRDRWNLPIEMIWGFTAMFMARSGKKGFVQNLCLLRAEAIFR